MHALSRIRLDVNIPSGARTFSRKYSLADVCKLMLVNFKRQHPLEDFPFTVIAREKIKQTLRDQSIVIPFHYVKGDIVVPIRLGGKTKQLILGTGASQSLIWQQKLANIAHSDELAVAILITSGKNGQVDVSFCTIPELELGPLRFSNLAMMVCQGPPTNAGDGILGGDILRNFALTIDYRRKQVRLLANPNQVSPKSIIVPMREVDNIPYLDGWPEWRSCSDCAVG